MELSCIIIDNDKHSTDELNKLIEITPGITYKNDFREIIKAIFYLKNNGKVDIIFCDISNADVNGLQTAAFLNEYCEFLIYTTNRKALPPGAKKLDISGWLVKPILLDKLWPQLNRITRSSRNAR